MARTARIAAVLAILAALLLANPLYVSAVVDQKERQPTAYAAVPVDPTDPSDQETIIQQLGNGEILHVGPMEAGYGSPHGAEYRAPKRAGALLRRARDNGSASTTAYAPSRTLHRIGARYEFVAIEHGDQPTYYGVAVANRSGRTVVTLTPANRSIVAWFVVDHDTVLFTSLPEYQRQTFRKLKSAGEYGYRPYNDETHRMADNLIVQNGTHYLIQERMHVDDFSIVPVLIRLGFTGLGVIFLLAALALTAKSFADESG